MAGIERESLRPVLARIRPVNGNYDLTLAARSSLGYYSSPLSFFVRLPRDTITSHRHDNRITYPMRSKLPEAHRVFRYESATTHCAVNVPQGHLRTPVDARISVQSQSAAQQLNIKKLPLFSDTIVIPVVAGSNPISHPISTSVIHER